MTFKQYLTEGKDKQYSDIEKYFLKKGYEVRVHVGYYNKEDLYLAVYDENTEDHEQMDYPVLELKSLEYNNESPAELFKRLEKQLKRLKLTKV